MNDHMELNELNEIDRDRETLGDEPYDPFLLKKKIIKIVKDDKKIRDKQLEKK